MKYKSAFDIIGPIMIGPSSSHTAGAARIGLFARKLFDKQPTEVVVSLYGSFAKTYKGHGTDVALIGGILNFDTDDTRIPQALQHAEELGMKTTFIESDEDTDHPNTAKIHLTDGKEHLDVVGISIGGGKMEIIEINGFPLSITGKKPALFITHEERYGGIANVTTLLAKYKYNISRMEASRKDNENTAVMIIEVDDDIHPEVLEPLRNLPHVKQVALIGE